VMPTVGSGVYWPGLVILGRGMPHWLSGLVYALNPLWPNYSLKIQRLTFLAEGRRRVHRADVKVFQLALNCGRIGPFKEFA
jgi:hypothetical protein